MRRLISGTELIEKKGWDTHTLLKRIQLGLQPYHPESKTPIVGASDMPSDMRQLEEKAWSWIRRNWTCYKNDIQTGADKQLKGHWTDWVNNKPGFLACLLEHDFDDGLPPFDILKPIINFWLPKTEDGPIDYSRSTEDHICSWLYDEAELLPTHLKKTDHSSELYLYLQQVSDHTLLIKNLERKLREDTLEKKQKRPLRALLCKLQGSTIAREIYRQVMAAEGKEGTTKDPARQARRWVEKGCQLALQMRLHNP